MVPTPMSRHTIAALALAAIVLLAALAAYFITPIGVLLRGEDSWAHYRSGGLFITHSPSPSPDGTMLYLAIPCTGHGDIYRYSVTTDHWFRLTKDDAFESSPLLSPDGTSIAYVKESAGCRHIWLMSADGKDQRPLTSGNVLDDPVEFTNDGKHLMILRSPLSFGMGRSVTSCIISTEKSNEVIQVGRNASFVPNQRAIVFEQQDDQIVYQVLADSEQIRDCGCQGVLPRVSADGAELMYVRDRGKDWTINNQIFLKNLDSGTDRLVGNGHSPVFLSPTGGAILFYSGYEAQLFLWTKESGRAIPISGPSGYKTPARPYLDRNGAVFASFGNAGRYEVFAINQSMLAASKLLSVDCSTLNLQLP
jgi:WD40-like Beta Propeller Repeat